MKLTTEQIQQIEEKLYADYDFYYDDTKHEVVDHIASEIEEEMKDNSFETSFDKVFQNWHSRLQETEWNGMLLYGKIKLPMFYKKQLMSSLYKDVLMLIVASLAFPLLLYFYKDSMEINTLNITVFIYKIVVLIIALFLNQYSLEKYENGDYTTIYGQIASFANNQTLIGLAIGAIPLIVMQMDFLKHKGGIDIWLLNLFFFNAFYFMFIIKYCNYFRHLKMAESIKKRVII